MCCSVPGVSLGERIFRSLCTSDNLVCLAAGPSFSANIFVVVFFLESLKIQKRFFEQQPFSPS